MITILKGESGALEVLETIIPGSWVKAVDPQPDELQQLTELGIPERMLSMALDPDERPRVEAADETTLILLRAPYFQGEDADVPYRSIGLGIILAGDVVVTISMRPYPVCDDMAAGRASDVSTAKRVRFVLQLLLGTADLFLKHVSGISAIVDRLEVKLEPSTRNREVLQLLRYQKSLTHFITALRANGLMLERLHRGRYLDRFPVDDALLDDVLLANEQALQMTETAGAILGLEMNAFASIVSNNLSRVMKMLASITIILSLPTVVASYYGMNVTLPLAGQWWAFLFIILVSLGLSIFAAYLFMRRDWF